MSYRERVRELIVADLTPLTSADLSDDADLPQNILDSLGIAEMLAFIESEIRRPLEPHEEVEGTIQNVNAIVAFIEANRAS